MATPKQQYSTVDEQQPPVAVPVPAGALGHWKVSVTSAQTNMSTDCCPCTTLSTTMSRVSKYSKVYAAAFGFFYTAALIVPLPFAILSPATLEWTTLLVSLFLLASVVLAAARFHLRSSFGIPGNPLEDCCWSFWCLPYTIAQMRTQVEDIVQVSNKTLPAYKA